MKRLYKSQTDRKISGVCGDVAEYLNVDSMWILLAWALLVFCVGTEIFAYILPALVLPDNSGIN